MNWTKKFHQFFSPVGVAIYGSHLINKYILFFKKKNAEWEGPIHGNQ